MAARENISNIGIVREYKNGNITLKVDLSGVDMVHDGLLWAVTENLFWVDTYIVREDYASYTLYNVRRGFIYCLDSSDMGQLAHGKMVRLVGRSPDPVEHEYITGVI